MMVIAGTTINDKGEIIDVYECKRHLTRSTFPMCDKCEAEIEAFREMQEEAIKEREEIDNWHEEEGSVGNL